MEKAVTDVGTSMYQFTEALGGSQQSLGLILRSPTEQKYFYANENSCFGTFPPMSA